MLAFQGVQRNKRLSGAAFASRCPIMFIGQEVLQRHQKKRPNVPSQPSSSRKRSPFGVRAHSHDPAVIGPMSMLDQPVALDASDEAGRGGGAEVEHVRDPAHGLRPIAAEQEQEAHLAKGQVAPGRRRHPALATLEDLEQVVGGGDQPRVRVD